MRPNLFEWHGLPRHDQKSIQNQRRDLRPVQPSSHRNFRKANVNARITRRCLRNAQTRRYHSASHSQPPRMAMMTHERMSYMPKPVLHNLTTMAGRSKTLKNKISAGKTSASDAHRDSTVHLRFCAGSFAVSFPDPTPDRLRPR